MKKLFAALSLALMTTAASAECILNSTTPNELRPVLREKGWDLKNYDVICKKMKAAGAKFVITGKGTVFRGGSVAWAAVHLADIKTNIILTETYQSTTGLVVETSQLAADTLLLNALYNAVNSWEADLDTGLAELAALKKKTFASK